MPDDTAIRSAAQHYMQRGWAIIVLYGVDGERRCGCGRPHANDGSAGKHPIGEDWTRRAISDPAAIPAGTNIGLLTGRASGVFALDVDPKNGGDARLAELVAEYGDLPPTWWQRTGSGGTHFAFSLPDDFTPTNSRGRLPVGLDIRGEGGQIVLAPSVSAVGPYEALVNADVLPAPAWLLDLIRPLPPIEVPAGMESAYMPESPTDRGAAYAHAAVQAELERLGSATPGERNHTAYAVACRLLEFANSPWSGFTEQAACEQFVAFGHRIVDETFTASELWACWRSACRTIGYNTAILPAPPGGPPSSLGWGDLGGAGTAPPFSPNGGHGASVPQPRDPFEDALPNSTQPAWNGPSRAMLALGAGVGQTSSSTTTPVPGTPHLRDFLLPRSQLSRLPRPVPLIKGVLWRDTDAWLIGESGSGKSFVGLDWAAHIASGRNWNEQRTFGGPVIWVVAEGASGIQQRVDAWEAAYGPVGDGLLVLPVAVQAAVRSGRALSVSPQWRQLCEIGAEIHPAMVMLDTQARMTRGIGENDNDEMGYWLEAVSTLRRAAQGACMLVVHHTGRNGSHARGASAIDGGQDIEWRVERTGARKDMRGRIVLDKGKDREDGTAYPFTLKSHRLGWDNEAEEYITSLTVSYDPFDQPEIELPQHEQATETATQGEILYVLREVVLPDGETEPRLLMKINELRKERAGRYGLVYDAMNRSTLTRALTRSDRKQGGLLERGLVERNGVKWADAERYAKWQAGS